MSKSKKLLMEWSSQGLITAEQVEHINAYERNKSGKTWVLPSLLILGACVICIGMISLIAANWYKFPPAAKLGADFILLILTAAAIIYASNTRKNILFEVLLVFFMLFCLGSIGLIAQIYNTGGELYQMLLFWAVITCGLAWIAQRLFIPIIWVAGLLVGITLSVMDSPTLQALFKDNFLGFPMAVPLFCAAAATLISWVKKNLLARAFQTWTIISGLIVLPMVDIFQGIEENIITPLSGFLPGYFFAIITLLGIVANNSYNKVQKLVLLLTLAIFLWIFHVSLVLSVLHLHVSDIQMMTMQAICTIAILGLVAIFMASAHKRKLFELFLALIGVKFVVIYFQAIGGLAATGIALIISGVLIIGLASLWHKYRKPLGAWIERWAL